MPVLDTPFKCRNGHSFNANAKLRARCPECGELTKRSFTVKLPDVIPDDTKDKDKHEPIVRKSPMLVREGRPRLVPTKKTVAAKKPALSPKKAPIAKKRATVKQPVKSLGKTASGIVRTHRVTRITTPSITGK